MQTSVLNKRGKFGVKILWRHTDMAIFVLRCFFDSPCRPSEGRQYSLDMRKTLFYVANNSIILCQMRSLASSHDVVCFAWATAFASCSPI